MRGGKKVYILRVKNRLKGFNLRLMTAIRSIQIECRNLFLGKHQNKSMQIKIPLLITNFKLAMPTERNKEW